MRVPYPLLLIFLIVAFLLLVRLTPDTLPFPVQGEYSDAVVSHYPNALYLQESVRSGQFPHWRDLLMSGQPFAANPLNKVWYPPQWLVILLPVTWHLNLMLSLHLLLAGIAMRAFGLRIGISSEASAVVGFAYALTPRIIAAAGAGHLDIVYAAAWFPAVLWSIHRLVTQPNRQHLALTSLICAMCFLADIRLSMFILATGAAFGLWMSGQLKLNWRILVFAALAVTLLFAALTAVEWLPMAQLSPYLSRTGLTAEDAGAFSLQPAQFITLLFSDRGGSHETMLYVGIPVLVLATLGILHKRHWFWIAAIIVSGLYALGSNGFLWSILIRIIPPLLLFRVPSRIWIVAVFALVVLAGYGLDALKDRTVQRRIMPLFVFMLFTLTVILFFAVMRLPLRPFVGDITIAALTATAVLIMMSQSFGVKQFYVVFIGLLILDLVWMDTTLIEGRSQTEWLDKYKPLAQTLINAHVTRLYTPDYSLPQQAAAYWHIPQFGGVDPFQLRDYIPEFEGATGTKVTRYSITLPPDEGTKNANQGAIIDAKRLAEWNVSHVLAGYPIESDGLKLVKTTDDGLYLYENTYTTSQQRTLIWETPNRVKVTNSGNIPLTVAVNVPGWISLEVPRPEEFRVRAAPGQSITAQYETPGFIPALSLSVGGLLLSLALLFGKNRYPLRSST